MNDINELLKYVEGNLILKDANSGVIFTLISFIASIITIMGISWQRILVNLKNWKDRNAIQYCILNPIYKLKTKERAFIYSLIETFKIMMPIIILLGILAICQYWLDFYRFKKNIDAYLLILLCIYSNILYTIIYKRKGYSKFYRIPFMLTGIILVDFVILKIVVNYCFPNKTEIMVNLLIIISVVNFIIIELIFKRKKINNEYGNNISNYLMLCRKLIALMYIILFLSDTINEKLSRIGDKVNIVSFIVWIILCNIEARINNSVKIKFTINKIHSSEITQQAIYQYAYDKVKYILDNGCTKIINSEEIQSIEYTIEDILGSTKKKKVICLLENNDVLSFDGYKFIKGLWVSFYKFNENGKEVKIINSKKIKRIIVEKNLGNVS